MVEGIQRRFLSLEAICFSVSSLLLGIYHITLGLPVDLSLGT